MTNDDKPPLIDWITLLIWGAIVLLFIAQILILARKPETGEYQNRNFYENQLAQSDVSPFSWKRYRTLATITAYSEMETCPNRDCITASGEIARRGVMACPSWIPFGTPIELDGTIFRCADRTHSRYNGRYDIWVGYGWDNYKKALEWGLRQKEIIIYH